MKIDPAGAALLLLFVGAAVAVRGVYLLAGQGWACIAAAVPLIVVGLVLARGLARTAADAPRG